MSENTFEFSVPAGSEREHEYVQTTGADIEMILAKSIASLARADVLDLDKIDRETKSILRVVVQQTVEQSSNVIEQLAFYAAICKSMIMTLHATIDNIEMQMDLLDDESDGE